MLAGGRPIRRGTIRYRTRTSTRTSNRTLYEYLLFAAKTVPRDEAIGGCGLFSHCHASKPHLPLVRRSGLTTLDAVWLHPNIRAGDRQQVQKLGACSRPK